jgi:general stress protein YciG
MSAKGKQGFASMTPERARAIASQGGKAIHAQGVAHHWTPETARAAGRKGGLAPHVNRPTAFASPDVPDDDATRRPA